MRQNNVPRKHVPARNKVYPYRAIPARGHARGNHRNACSGNPAPRRIVYGPTGRNQRKAHQYTTRCKTRSKHAGTHRRIEKHKYQRKIDIFINYETPLLFIMKKLGIKKSGNPLSYAERLALWKQRKCPYCGSTNITRTAAARGGDHYSCGNENCGAQNHFSKRIP